MKVLLINLRTLLIFLSVTLTGRAAVAQYAGGRGDGFTRRTIVEVTFDGVPAGVRALFIGGRADGHASLRSPGFLVGSASLTVLYAGGAGDGFDKTTVSQVLGGQSVRQLYLGGAGDGFDRADVQLLINGRSLSALFAGGQGDGFDRAVVSTLVSGRSLAALYRGGGGDGFDRAGFFGGVPTPLTLLRFEALVEGDSVIVRWQTENERDTDFFTVERTKGGRTFTEAGSEPAAGYTIAGERTEYQLLDVDPYEGTSYYRLRTTDFDGTISLSHLVEVRRATTEAWSVSIFPNPNTGRHVSVAVQGGKTGDHLAIDVYNTAGNLLLTRAVSVRSGTVLRLEFPQRLSAGSYFIRTVRNAGEVSSNLLIVR